MLPALVKKAFELRSVAMPVDKVIPVVAEKNDDKKEDDNEESLVHEQQKAKM